MRGVLPVRMEWGRVLNMRRLIAVVIFLFAGMQPSFVWAGTVLPVVNEEDLIRAAECFQQADWNGAEAGYLKVTQSPNVELRIRAFQGLSELYKKIHAHKKRRRVEQKLEMEKSFYEQLVPSSLLHYESYIVCQGDSYHQLAVGRGISEAWLRKINRQKELMAGMRIFIPVDQDNIFIDKGLRRLVWFRGATIIKIYSIAIGKKETETPEGDYRIVDKIANPTWYKEHEVIPPGDPKNLLGTRWLGLDHKGYGIHGTKNPHSIGLAASHGCVRMLNRDVEELFDWIPIGTRVLIQNTAAVDHSTPNG